MKARYDHLAGVPHVIPAPPQLGGIATRRSLRLMSTDASIDDPYLPIAFSLFSTPGAYAVLAGAGVSR
jgi:hypothetical protein